MDEKTASFYRENASGLFDFYRSAGTPFDTDILNVFRPGERVLDGGCGSGRDLKKLLERGIDARGMEPSEELIRLTLEADPDLAGRIRQGAFPDDVPDFPGGGFDGILLSAVLMHIPDRDLSGLTSALKSLLRPGGRLILSSASERDDVTGNRDRTGRLMILRSREEILRIFEDAGFRLIRESSSADGQNRPGVIWYTAVFHLPA